MEISFGIVGGVFKHQIEVDRVSDFHPDVFEVGPKEWHVNRGGSCIVLGLGDVRAKRALVLHEEVV